MENLMAISSFGVSLKESGQWLLSNRTVQSPLAQTLCGSAWELFMDISETAGQQEQTEHTGTTEKNWCGPVCQSSPKF